MSDRTNETGDDAPVQTRPRRGFQIGNNRQQMPPTPPTPVQTTPPVPTTDSDTSSDSDEWGTALAEALQITTGSDDLGSTPPQPVQPRPVRRRRFAISQDEAMAMMTTSPEMLAQMRPDALSQAYMSADGAGRQQMLTALKQPAGVGKLAKLIENGSEAGPELQRILLAENNQAVLSAVLGQLGNSTGADNFVKAVMANPSSDRAQVRALTGACARDIIVEAADVGTAGRGNTGRTNLLSKMGASGESGRSVTELLSGAALTLDTIRIPSQASLKDGDLKDVPSEHRPKIIAQTLNAIETVLRTIADDLARKPISPDLTMITAEVFRAAQQRFDDDTAAILAGGHIFLRVIGPAVVPGLTKKELPNSGARPSPQQTKILIAVTKVLQNVANRVPFSGSKEPELVVLQPIFNEISSAVNSFVARAVESGRLYLALEQDAPGIDAADTRDMLRAAQADPRLGAKLFARPDRDFPYGTRPLDKMSPLGQAIDVAARGRDRQVRFDEVRMLPAFEEMVASERQAVLDATVV